MLVLLTLAAYLNSFSGPFILDDVQSIPLNRTIRGFWNFWDVFSSSLAQGQTVGGRPLLNLSFALNYLAGGYSVWGYHLVNLLIHLLVALVLFGILRRTFLQPVLREKYRHDSLLLAWLIAVLWAVHPLQTESVTYIAQRAESLVSLFYLLTLYCFVRAITSPHANGWLLFSVTCCFLGAVSKEVIVSAPLVVLLYDRTFVSGTFSRAWQERKSYYLALAATWIVLGVIIGVTGTRGGTTGIVHESWPVYFINEFPILVRYFRLALWPQPLVLVYGQRWVSPPWQIVASMALIIPLMALIAWALRTAPTPARRWPALGFLGAAFFLILAPTSSVVPLLDPMYEHRMYLALATVLTTIVLGLHETLGRRGLIVCLVVTLPVLTTLTLLRNEDYRTEFSIWSDCVAKRPQNFRSRNNLALVLVKLNRIPEALAQYQEALHIDPKNAQVRCNMGEAYDQAGQLPRALELYREAAQIDPSCAQAYANRAVVLAQLGRSAEAMAEDQKALQLRPGYAPAENNLGVILVGLGRRPEAIPHYQAAIDSNPDYAKAHSNLGEALGESGRFAEAIEQYRAALAIDGRDPEAHYNIGVALTQLGRIPEAIGEYQAALQIDPHYEHARDNLAALQR